MTAREDTLGRLYSELAPKLTAELSRRTPHAEDIVAEAFAQLAQRLARGYRADNPEGLLRTIAWHAAATQYRENDERRKYEVPAGLVSDLAAIEEERWGSGRTPGLAEHRFATDFDRGVRALDEDDRHAFILTELRGLTDRAAADALDTYPMDTNRRAERARIAIREEIA